MTAQSELYRHAFSSSEPPHPQPRSREVCTVKYRTELKKKPRSERRVQAPAGQRRDLKCYATKIQLNHGTFVDRVAFQASGAGSARESAGDLGEHEIKGS